jgi:hypothetical protein
MAIRGCSKQMKNRDGRSSSTRSIQLMTHSGLPSGLLVVGLFGVWFPVGFRSSHRKTKGFVDIAHYAYPFHGSLPDPVSKLEPFRQYTPFSIFAPEEY